MNYFQFLAMVIKRAFEPAWKAADTTATIIGLFAGLVTWLLPRVEPVVDIATWVIPLAILFPVLLYRLIAAPYLIFIEQKNVADQAIDDLASIQESLPNLILTSIRDTQLFRNGEPIFHPIQARFANAPENPQVQSIARDVSARIEFIPEAETDPRVSVFGVWAISEAPDFVGYRGLTNTIDIPPSHIPAKLMVALKYLDEPSAYAFSIEGLSRGEDGRDSVSELPPGKYEVFVHLRGVGIDQTHSLMLSNPGPGSPLELEST